MTGILKAKTVATLLAAATALALLAGLALAVSSDDSTLVLNTAEDTPLAQAEDGDGGGGAEANADEGEEGEADRPHRRCRGRGGPLGGAIHGELIVPERPESSEDGEGEGADEDAEPTFETVVMDRGEVVSVDGNSVTIERPDGERVTVRITDDTKMGDGEISVGDRVHVMADTEGNARVVAGHNRPQPEGEGEARPCWRPE